MKILNLSNMPLWLWGDQKGIPSIFFTQKEFVARGYQVHFLCPLQDKEARYELFSGISLYRFDFPFNYKKVIYIQSGKVLNHIKATVLNNLNWFFFQVFGVFFGVKLGLQVKPDIIYAHSLTSVFPAYLVSRILGAKLVVRVYGVRQLYRQWDNFWLRLKEWRDYLAFRIPADYFIITDDGGYGNLLAKKLGVSEARIKYWRNGIDEDMYNIEPNAKQEICQHLKIDPSFNIVVSTSRLIYDYGVDRLLAALVEFFKENHNTVCLIAASGPEQKKLEEFTKDTGISSRVFFLGIIDRQMIKKILYAADIFVFLSRFHNCTNTIWEAMACGKCIVTTENEAIKEVFASEENAILIPENRISEVPEILHRLLVNPALIEKISRNVRLQAKQVLESWPRRVKKEAELLEKLTSSQMRHGL